MDLKRQKNQTFARKETKWHLLIRFLANWNIRGENNWIKTHL